VGTNDTLRLGRAATLELGDEVLSERCNMKRHYGRVGIVLTLLLGLWGSSMSGCAVFRATGRSVEAVGAGAGAAVSGTGRAVSRAATETEQEIKGRR